MKKKLISIFIICLSSVLLIFISFVLLLSLYYKGKFPYNVWINDRYMTGKSLEEANALLKDSFKTGTLTISYDGIEDEVDLSDYIAGIDYEKALNRVYLKSKLNFWFANKSTWEESINISPEITLNKEKLNEALKSLKCLSKYQESVEHNVSIEFSEDNGFYLKESLNKVVSQDELLDWLYESLSESSLDEDLSLQIPETVFSDLVITDEMEKAYSEWDFVKDFLETKFTLDMGDEVIPFDGSVLSKFITYSSEEESFERDSEGNLLISDASIEEYLNGIFDKYDTYKKPRTYRSINNEIKTFETTNYGTLINREYEIKYITEAIHNGTVENHVPAYTKLPYHRGLNDVGPDYIEIDLTRQKLYFVKDGELFLETDVVTGKPSAGNATPELFTYVYRKQKNAVLVGEGYRSHVDYWMPVYKGIGLHDATWQKQFGGDWYLNHGSHGCINLAYDDAELIYNNISVGIPVIIYK